MYSITDFKIKIFISKLARFKTRQPPRSELEEAKKASVVREGEPKAKTCAAKPRRAIVGGQNMVVDSRD